MTRVAIVTGAARGIGAAIADRLEGEGFAVARLDIGYEAGGGRHMRFDLAAIDTHDNGLAGIEREFGPIEVLVNNAGIASPERGDFLALQPTSFDRVMEVNLRGTIFLTQAVLRRMIATKARGRRQVQFITSASAVAASPERLDYCISKAGLSMFVKGLALRFAAEGIDVFEIRPGIIATDMTAPVAARYDGLIADGLVPERRWGRPEDVAAISAALALGALPFATGTVIDAGGGLAIPRL